jgi:hypothetical protein
VIKMEVRDDDRVDARPAFLLAQARQDAWTAIEQRATRALDEISGLRAARIRPGRGATDDRQLHGCSVA